MTVELTPETERRLWAIAQQRAIPVPQLIEQVLTQYLLSVPDDPATWVAATRAELSKSWPDEDFSDWRPPDGT